MNELTTTRTLAEVSTIADTFAQSIVFADYRSRKSANTISNHDLALKAFAGYLSGLNVRADAQGLATSPECWHGITHGIVKGFIGYLLNNGFSCTTINNRLSAIKNYAKLAMIAGAMTNDTFGKISAIKGYSVREAGRINAGREIVRVGTKKTPETLTGEQLKMLYRQADTPQGKRDAVMLRLMGDLGLRVGELVGLNIEGINLERNTIYFYREKVSKWQTHRLTNGLLTAIREYLSVLAAIGITSGKLIRASVKGGLLIHRPMNRQTIEQRLKTLGASIGIDALSPHDLRHTWATLAAQRGTPITALRDAGGWASLAMPSRYIEASEIANSGVIGEQP